MKKATNRILSFLTAFAMVIGVLVAPFTSANAAEAKYENSTNKIVIHKILFNEDDYNAWKPEEHKSTKVDDIKTFFGEGAKEITGVAYDVYKEADATETNKANGTELNNKFNTNEFKTDKYYSIVNNDLITKDQTEKDYEKGTDELELDNGSYVIVENADRTTYQDPTTGQTVSKQGKAIPVRITLPFILPKENTTGVLHLYPKNTTVDSPDTEKDFADRININNANDTNAQDAKKNEDNYRVSGVGQPVPYTVETVFKAGSNLKHAYWNDQMTKGLTFTQEDLDAMKIYVNREDKTSSFTKTMDGNGFKVTLNDMTLVNGKDANVTVRLEYSAKLNEQSKVDIPESNDVTFHYGNNPSDGNTPKPQTPENGKISVSKTFEEKLNNNKPEKLLVQLYNANTGEKVGNEIDLAQNEWKYEWSGLSADYQYKVVEVSTGYEVVYGLGEAGQITILNNENDNPSPKNPEEPKVIRYGKKFVKADETDGKRLQGAEFVIRGEKGKYLVKKTDEELAADKTAYDKAIAEYDAVYKNPDKTQEELNALFDTVKTTAEALNNKYKWAEAEEGEKALDKNSAKDLANIVKLTSNEKGQFKIEDLQAGTYYLEEIAAPDGYAVRDGEFDFTVGKGSYSADAKGVVYEGTENVVNEADGADAMRVNNRNVTIPQTGGMGSLIFIVAGLAIMGLAFVMKRRNAVEA